MRNNNVSTGKLLTKASILLSIFTLILISVAFFGLSVSANTETKYFLPYKEDLTARMTQGPGGDFSHDFVTTLHAYDFVIPGGKIIASAPGEVIKSVNDVSGNSYYNYAPSVPAFGNEVVIKHSDGSCTQYTHFAHGTVLVAVGDSVTQGQDLGDQGNTGYSSGAHLHFSKINCTTSVSLPINFVEDGWTSKNETADADNDGVPDGLDACDDFVGLWEHNGCSSNPGGWNLNKDFDEDGIQNWADACDYVKGVQNDNFLKNGCPPDADNDGIYDRDDDCINQFGPAQHRGCPDSDGDNVRDIDDRCPAQVGLASNGGCPDGDEDGVLDAQDTCPEVKGLSSLQGCPERLEVDFSGDGTDDIAWLQGRTLMMMYGNKGFWNNPNLSLRMTPRDVITVGDFANTSGVAVPDGRSDIALYEPGGIIRSLSYHDQLGWRWGYLRGPNLGVPRWMKAGDFNGDGRDDIAWLQGRTLMMMDGAKGFDNDPAKSMVITPTDIVTVGDFVGRLGSVGKDGRSDLALYTEDGYIKTLSWDDDLGWRWGELRGPNLGQPQWMKAGDFNGDGHDDIAWIQSGKLELFNGKPGHGLGRLGNVLSVTVREAMTVGDYADSMGGSTPDGRSDIAIYTPNKGFLLSLSFDDHYGWRWGRLRGPDLGQPSWMNANE